MITKPIYVLTIDTKNNINISVIFINGHAQEKNKITDKKRKIGETHLFPQQPKSKINFNTSDEILDSYSISNKNNNSNKFPPIIKSLYRIYN